jgi:Fe-S cluster assembly iron-binding protein IscA
MLAVTPAATEALVSLLRAPEVPEGAGARLAHGLAAGGEPSIGLTIVSRPDATDEVIDAGGGVDVFVDRAAADALDDQQLDVEMDAERLAFTLRRQPPAAGRRPRKRPFPRAVTAHARTHRPDAAEVPVPDPRPPVPDPVPPIPEPDPAPPIPEPEPVPRA